MKTTFTSQCNNISVGDMLSNIFYVVTYAPKDSIWRVNDVVFRIHGDCVYNLRTMGFNTCEHLRTKEYSFREFTRGDKLVIEG